MKMAADNEGMFGPLVFGSKTKDETLHKPDTFPCMFCDKLWSAHDKPDKDLYLRHLLQIHKVVIADVPLIADLQRYTEYWKERLKSAAVTDIFSAIQTNSSQDDPESPEMYYLLCDVLPEDKELRIKLQKDKLEEVLAQQQREREDTSFSHGCLFCRSEFSGNRSGLFKHLSEEHNFNVGHIDNLVYTDEYLETLNNKLHSLQCLYCEHTFKDRQVLKEHMRKKGHKRINPKNPFYDKFYVVNYLELGKNWEVIQSEDDDTQSMQSLNNNDWSDWRAEVGLQSQCLFCDHSEETMDNTQAHMKEKHDFDLKAIKQELNLTFYQQVKLVNYIRRQMYQNRCMSCEERCVNREELERHWSATGHGGRIPPLKDWDQPQYYFPTYEDDNLLCELDDGGEEDEGYIGDTSDEAIERMVIAEDFSAQQLVLREQSVLKDLVASS